MTTILTAPSTPRAFRVDSAQRSYYYIVPKSVLGNWYREFTKWCPTLKVL